MVYAFGLVSSFFYAVGLVLQQHVASSAPARDRGSVRLLWDLVRSSVWLAGLAVMIIGQVTGALALDHGSLTLAEPLTATSLLFALPMSAAWTRQRLGAREYVGALTLIAGLTIFILSSGSNKISRTTVADSGWLLAGLPIAAVVLILVLAAKRTNLGEEATLLGAAAGVLFGLQDALTQRSFLVFDHGVVALFTSWQPYAFAVVGVVGLGIYQEAFAIAPLPASLPASTAAEPLTGIALGAGLFDEPLRLQSFYLALEVLGLVLIVAGVFLVARSRVVTGFEQSAELTESTGADTSSVARRQDGVRRP
jgi:drug/metabolite transporter (DMT)-like permease